MVAQTLMSRCKSLLRSSVVLKGHTDGLMWRRAPLRQYPRVCSDAWVPSNRGLGEDRQDKGKRIMVQK